MEKYRRINVLKSSQNSKQNACVWLQFSKVGDLMLEMLSREDCYSCLSANLIKFFSEYF